MYRWHELHETISSRWSLLRCADPYFSAWYLYRNISINTAQKHQNPWPKTQLLDWSGFEMSAWAAMWNFAWDKFFKEHTISTGLMTFWCEIKKIRSKPDSEGTGKKGAQPMQGNHPRYSRICFEFAKQYPEGVPPLFFWGVVFVEEHAHFEQLVLDIRMIPWVAESDFKTGPLPTLISYFCDVARNLLSLCALFLSSSLLYW